MCENTNVLRSVKVCIFNSVVNHINLPLGHNIFCAKTKQVPVKLELVVHHSE